MYRSLPLAFCLACQPAIPSLFTSAPPVLRTLLIDAPVFVSQGDAKVHVYGANPGDTVTIVRGSSIGTACSTTLQGSCLDIGPQPAVLGSTTANAFGTAELAVTAPALPHGATIALQAVVHGSTPRISEPVLTRSARRSDLDVADLGYGDLIITEVHVNTRPDADGEWFELYNNTNAIVDLDGLRVEDGTGHSFTVNGTTLVEPEGYIVMASSDDLAKTDGLYPDVVAPLDLTRREDAIYLGSYGAWLDLVVWNDAEYPYTVDASMQLAGEPDVLLNNYPNFWCDSTYTALGSRLGTPGGANDATCVLASSPAQPQYTGDENVSPVPTGPTCDNSCSDAFDGVCNEGGTFSTCAAGTDCHDCTYDGCANTCQFAFDGECDDGRPGADYDLCDFGTDCGDCVGDRPWANQPNPTPTPTPTPVPTPVPDLPNLCRDVPAPPQIAETACTHNTGKIYANGVEHLTLQFAIDATPDHGVVELCGGTFYEHDLLIERSITIRSLTAGPATIHARGQGRVLQILPDSPVPINVKLHNLRLKGGEGVRGEWGSALHMYSDTAGHQLSLHDMLIEGNAARHSIAAFDFEGDVWLSDVRVRNNRQTEPNVSSNHGILTMLRAKVSADRLVLSHNQATGSGITMPGSGLADLTFDNSRIHDNSVGAGYAAVLVEDGASMRACDTDFGTGAAANTPVDVSHITGTFTALGDDTTLLCTDIGCH